MMQELEAQNHTDENGNPAGGYVRGRGFDIQWQDGPLGRGEDRKQPNGAFVEGVIQAALQRVVYYQNSKFACKENAQAILRLQEAINWLNYRTTKREEKGVEGTHEK